MLRILQPELRKASNILLRGRISHFQFPLYLQRKIHPLLMTKSKRQRLDLVIYIIDQFLELSYMFHVVLGQIFALL